MRSATVQAGRRTGSQSGWSCKSSITRWRGEAPDLGAMSGQCIPALRRGSKTRQLRSTLAGRPPCEHVFVTSQGSASGRFQRACDRGQVMQAEMAAREMGWVSLIHALSLVVLYARVESPKFEAAAVRWLARLALEGRDVGLDEIQLAAASLGCLRGPRHERAAKTLSSLL